MKILLLDNYDSFTFNLVHLLESFDGIEVDVKRNDSFSIGDADDYDKLVLSPGPGLPSEAGILMPLIKETAGKKSMLGVCLGMQAMAEVFGGTLFNLEKVQHGVASEITVTDDTEKIFKNLPAKFKTGRYHSWMVDQKTLPDCFRITSVDDSNQIMSFRHKDFDICGVQFHPESVLTEYGKDIIKNWLM